MNLRYSLSHNYKLVSNSFNISYIDIIGCSYMFVNYFCPFDMNLFTSDITSCVHSRLWCVKWHSMQKLWSFFIHLLLLLLIFLSLDF